MLRNERTCSTATPPGCTVVREYGLMPKGAKRCGRAETECFAPWLQDRKNPGHPHCEMQCAHVWSQFADARGMLE